MKRMRERDKIRETVGEWPQLSELDPETATVEEVENIIGRYGWLRQSSCDECGIQTWDIVEIGEPPYYESATAYVCLDCLKKAIALLEGKE